LNVKSILALPHWPILLYLTTALVLTIGGRRLSSRLRNGLAAGVCVAVGLVLVYVRASIPVDVVFSDWLVHLTLLGSLVYHVDHLNWTFAAMLTLIVAAKLIWTALDREHNRDTRLTPGLLLLSAAGYSILFAGNLLTLLLSWAVLMAASLVLLTLGQSGTRTARRYLLLFGVGALFLLWASWDAGRGDGGRWASLALSHPAALALLITSWIALGAYPLQIWLPLDCCGDTRDDVLAALLIVPPLLGLYLLARLSLLANGQLLRQDIPLGFGAVSLLIGAELAWMQPRKPAALACVAAALGGALVAGVSFPPTQSLYIILPWAMAMPPALLVLMWVPSRAGADDPEWLDVFLRVVTGLAGATLIGLPPTSGFVVWSRLESAVRALGNPTLTALLIGVLVVAGGLCAATLLRFWLVPRPAGRVRNALELALISAVLLLPMLVVAVRPRWAVVRIVGPSITSAYNLTDVALTPGLWTTLLPITLGFLLTVAMLRGQVEPDAAYWGRLAMVWRLEWAADLLAMLGRWLVGIVETVTDLVHGDHHLVWAFLAVIVFLWFYLFP
jgi:multicomponent Na+:H+ antiporter subunit D